MKYISINENDFWINEHKLNEVQKNDSVELYIYDDKNGENHFHGIEIYIADVMRKNIDDKYFEEDYEDEKEREDYIKYYNKLKNGEVYCVIEGVIYKDYEPSIKECNSFKTSGKGVLSIKSPPQKAAYTRVYVNEKGITSREILFNCLDKLFEIFGFEKTQFAFSWEKTREQTIKNSSVDEYGVYY